MKSFSKPNRTEASRPCTNTKFKEIQISFNTLMSFFQLFVSQKLGYISEINILFRLSHIQHVLSSSIPIGAGSPNWIGEWESGCRNRWVRKWRRFSKLKLTLEKRVKVIFKFLEDTKADLVGNGFENPRATAEVGVEMEEAVAVGRELGREREDWGVIHLILGIRFERERVWKWKGFEKISRFGFGNKFERGRRDVGD